MIIRHPILDEFERRQRAAPAASIEENIRIFDALLVYARQLRSLPGPEPLEGLETDIRLARVLNAG
jgi:hypothetical protein